MTRGRCSVYSPITPTPSTTTAVCALTTILTSPITAEAFTTTWRVANSASRRSSVTLPISANADWVSSTRQRPTRRVSDITENVAG